MVVKMQEYQTNHAFVHSLPTPNAIRNIKWTPQPATMSQRSLQTLIFETTVNRKWPPPLR